MRVYVRIGQGANELRQDLDRLPANQRAERLRILASIGLSVLTSGHVAKGDDKALPVEKKKSAVASSLLHSLGGK